MIVWRSCLGVEVQRTPYFQSLFLALSEIVWAGFECPKPHLVPPLHFYIKSVGDGLKHGIINKCHYLTHHLQKGMKTNLSLKQCIRRVHLSILLLDFQHKFEKRRYQIFCSELWTGFFSYEILISPRRWALHTFVTCISQSNSKTMSHFF